MIRMAVTLKFDADEWIEVAEDVRPGGIIQTMRFVVVYRGVDIECESLDDVMQFAASLLPQPAPLPSVSDAQEGT